MIQLFPQPVTSMPEADIPINGIKAFLWQGVPKNQLNRIYKLKIGI